MAPLWFKAKRYGYGWYPCTWQGWAVLAVYIAGFTGITLGAESMTSASDVLLRIVIPEIALTCLLLIISVLTGEKARWRWGEDGINN